MAEPPKQDIKHNEDGNWSLDRATDEAIKSNFDPIVVGTLLNRCLDETESIEQVIAFAAILGKQGLLGVESVTGRSEGLWLEVPVRERPMTGIVATPKKQRRG